MQKSKFGKFTHKTGSHMSNSDRGAFYRFPDVAAGLCANSRGLF